MSLTLTAGAPSQFVDRARRWTLVLSTYFGAAGLTQAASVLAGLLFVNFLSVEEFALYTLATSILTFFAFVTDLGSTSSLLYFFHRLRGTSDGETFPKYVSAVLSLRRLGFAVGATLVLPVFLWMARVEGFAWGAAGLASAAILLSVPTQIEASLRVLVLRLSDRYSLSYRAELLGALARLLAAAGLVVVGALQAWLAVLAGVVASLVTALVAAPGALPAVAPEPARRREVLRYLLPTLPAALYFSIQGPVVVWLAATFGGTRQIAEVGALGRLGLVVSLFSGLAGVVFLPRLAHITDETVYRARYAQFAGLLLGLGALLVSAALVAPDALLLLIGRRYVGLHHELVLVMISAVLSLVGGFAVGVNNARAWTRWQGLAVLLLFVSQTALVATLSLETSAGILLFSAASAGVGLALQVLITGLGFLQPRLVAWTVA